MTPMTSATPVEATIGGTTFKIYTLDATKGHPLYFKLLGKVGSVLEAGGDIKAAGPELAVRMLGKALQALDPALMQEMIAVFGSSSHVVNADGSTQPVSSVFPVLFAGKYGHMLGWLFECAKVNFSDFLPPNLPGLPGLDVATLFQSASPKT